MVYPPFVRSRLLESQKAVMFSFRFFSSLGMYAALPAQGARQIGRWRVNRKQCKDHYGDLSPPCSHSIASNVLND